MTIEEAIQGLKQYIHVSLNQRMEQRMATKEDLFESQRAIAETLTTAIDALAPKDQVDDHERRIIRLEHCSV